MLKTIQEFSDRMGLPTKTPNEQAPAIIQDPFIPQLDKQWELD